ncbi:MAG: agmatine deiminase family protein [bacterium]
MSRLRLLPLVALSLSLASAPALAERDVDGIEELLPHAESRLEWERLAESGQQPIGRGLRADPPPAAPIRNCGEWEPLTGVLIRYPLGLPYTLLQDLDDWGTLHVVVSSANLTNATNAFNANGVNLANVQFLVKPNNSIWTRDYGPWFVFDGNGDCAIIDHVYNRPARPNDDLIPVEFAIQQGLPYYRHDMWHTGGNYMTDGAHFSMSTDLVYNEALSANGLTSTQVDQLMNDYYGIDQYNVVQDIAAGGIHHIDTWGKFLDEESILIKETVSTHYTYAALEQRATLIASLPASTGRNYRVHRVFCQLISGGEPASYTNSLIMNDHVCVPMFANATRDSAALDVYRAAMPGYDVRGYAYSGWLTDDALHCRAKGVMDREMLRVAHVPVRDAQEGPVTIVAEVDDRSETGLTAVELHYRFAADVWNTVAMSATGGDLYEGTIPAPGAATDVDYYVLAADASGRQEGMPRSAPAGWYTFPISPAPTDAPVAHRLGDPHAWPNPFTDESRFSFELKYADRVDLAVYDVGGRLVRRLVNEERPAGRSEIVWDGRDDAGVRLPAGVYYYRLRAAGIAYSRPVVLAH